MTPIELLQEKFRQTGHRTVTDWMTETRISLSLQTCTAVLLRGQNKGLIALLTLAATLDCTPEELEWIAKEKGDRSLWRLFVKEVINNDEKHMLEEYRALSKARQQMVKSMVHSLVGEMRDERSPVDEPPATPTTKPATKPGRRTT